MDEKEALKLPIKKQKLKKKKKIWKSKKVPGVKITYKTLWVSYIALVRQY